MFKLGEMVLVGSARRANGRQMLSNYTRPFEGGAVICVSSLTAPLLHPVYFTTHTHTHFAKGHSSFNCEELANSRGLSRGRSGENLPRPFDAWHRLKNLILTFFYRHYESQALPAEKQRDVYSHFKPFTHEYAVLLFVSTWGEFLAECHF